MPTTPPPTAKPSSSRSVNLIAGRDRPTPVAANYFHFSRIGPDYEMLVCYADLRGLAQQMTSGAPGSTSEYTAEVVARVSMSVVGMKLLHEQLTKMINALGGPDQLAQRAQAALTND